MPKKKASKRGKRGPKEELLKITDDPAAALQRLLKNPKPKPSK